MTFKYFANRIRVMSEFDQRIGSVDLVEFYGEVTSFNLQRLEEEFKKYFGGKGPGRNLSEEQREVVKDYARNLTMSWGRPDVIVKAQSVRNPVLENEEKKLMENLGIKPWELLTEDLHDLHLTGYQEAGLDRRACYLAKKATSKLTDKK